MGALGTACGEQGQTPVVLALSRWDAVGHPPTASTRQPVCPLERMAGCSGEPQGQGAFTGCSLALAWDSGPFSWLSRGCSCSC